MWLIKDGISVKTLVKLHHIKYYNFIYQLLCYPIKSIQITLDEGMFSILRKWNTMFEAISFKR